MYRRTIYSLVVLVVSLSVIGLNLKMQLISYAAPSLEPGSWPLPTIYLSTHPNICANFYGQTYWVYVHSPDDNSLNYVSCDIDVGAVAQSPPLVSPGEGVVLGEVDVSKSPYHIEAAWTPRTLDHEPIIRLYYLTEPALSASPTNVVFKNTGGVSVPGTGIWTFSCCLDCFTCSVGFFAPTQVSAIIGKTTVIPFNWSWYCWTSGGGPLSASDTEGWILSWAPSSVWDGPTCSLCFVPRYDGWVEVTVPDGIQVGTTSQLTITSGGSTKIITLEAEEEIPTENTTWGKIKAIYR